MSNYWQEQQRLQQLEEQRRRQERDPIGGNLGSRPLQQQQQGQGQQNQQQLQEMLNNGNFEQLFNLNMRQMQEQEKMSPSMGSVRVSSYNRGEANNNPLGSPLNGQSYLRSDEDRLARIQGNHRAKEQEREIYSQPSPQHQRATEAVARRKAEQGGQWTPSPGDFIQTTGIQAPVSPPRRQAQQTALDSIFGGNPDVDSHITDPMNSDLYNPRHRDDASIRNEIRKNGSADLGNKYDIVLNSGTDMMHYQAAQDAAERGDPSGLLTPQSIDYYNRIINPNPRGRQAPSQPMSSPQSYLPPGTRIPLYSPDSNSPSSPVSAPPPVSQSPSRPAPSAPSSPPVTTKDIVQAVVQGELPAIELDPLVAKGEITPEEADAIAEQEVSTRNQPQRVIKTQPQEVQQDVLGGVNRPVPTGRQVAQSLLNEPFDSPFSDPYPGVSGILPQLSLLAQQIFGGVADTVGPTLFGPNQGESHRQRFEKKVREKRLEQALNRKKIQHSR